VAKDGLISRIGPACFAGSDPQSYLEIYQARTEKADAGCVSASPVLPRGLCAFIYQRSDTVKPRAGREICVRRDSSDSVLMDAMLEANA
jgi:hypothetical protein